MFFSKLSDVLIVSGASWKRMISQLKPQCDAHNLGEKALIKEEPLVRFEALGFCLLFSDLWFEF